MPPLEKRCFIFTRGKSVHTYDGISRAVSISLLAFVNFPGHHPERIPRAQRDSDSTTCELCER